MTHEPHAIGDGPQVVVVGGGIAGLAATRLLRRAGVRALLLESEARTGGRASTIAMGPFSFNTAAQVITGDRGSTSVLAAELGVGTALIPKQRMPIHMHGGYVRARTEPGFLLRLPISPVDKVRMGASVLSMRYRRRHASTLPAADVAADPEARRLEATSVADLVGAHRSDDLRALWDTLSISVTSVPCDQASALVAIKTVPTLQSRAEYAIVGGTGALTAALLRDVQHLTVTGARVVSVRQRDDRVDIRCLHDGVERTISAGQVVMAVPAPEVLAIVEDLPPQKRAALAATDYRPLTTAAFLHEGPTDAVLGRGVWRIPVVGGPIVGVVNATAWEPPDVRDASGQGLIRVQATDTASERLAGRPDDEVATTLADALIQLFPALRGRIVASEVAHWRHGVSPWRPGRVERLPALRASTGRVHYCGDYLDEQGMSGSIESAAAAVRAVTGVPGPQADRTGPA